MSTSISFPKKFFPSIENKDFFNDKDGVKLIVVSKEFSKISFDDISSLLNEWKKKYRTNSPKSANISSNSFKCNNINDVIESLKTFPIESKSPIECLLFLSDLKKKIIKKLLFLNLPYLQKIGEFNDNFTKFEESKLSII